MSKQSLLLSAAIAFLLVLSADAQEKTAAPGVSGNGTGRGTGTVALEPKVLPGVVSGVIGSFIGPPGSGITGAPFSADVIDETEQFLTDGNRIHHETQGKIFRDSQGRTRSETQMQGVNGKRPVFIHIVDPVEKLFIVLHPEEKWATVQHIGNFAPREPRSVAPANPTTASHDGNSTAEAHSLLNGVRQVQDSREDLGTREIEGFVARGTRIVFTVPAGEVGNDKPMTNTNERWYSEDLKTDLLMLSEGPQSGKHVHKLVNIRSGDPDPLLFQVPPDYTVREQPQR